MSGCAGAADGQTRHRGSTRTENSHGRTRTANPRVASSMPSLAIQAGQITRLRRSRGDRANLTQRCLDLLGEIQRHQESSRPLHGKLRSCLGSARRSDLDRSFGGGRRPPLTPNTFSKAMNPPGETNLACVGGSGPRFIHAAHVSGACGSNVGMVGRSSLHASVRPDRKPVPRGANSHLCVPVAKKSLPSFAASTS